MFGRRSTPPVAWEDASTQREDVPWWRAQSAVHTPQEAGSGADASGPARTRAGAREDNDQTALPQPHSAADSAATQGDQNPPPATAQPPADTVPADTSPVDTTTATDATGTTGGEQAPGRWRTAGTGLAAWWGATPPDFWAEPRPSLERIGWYAKRGEWTTPTGLYRWAGVSYHYVVALPCVATLYALAWITQGLGASIWRLPDISPPNDIHADDLTAPAAVWKAVTTGLAAAAPGPVRTAGLAYAWFAIPLITCCYAAAWTIERFWRLVAIATLPALLTGLIPLP
jgi:hypothetical protein